MAEYYSVGLIDDAIRPSVRSFSAIERSPTSKNSAEDQSKESRYRICMIRVCLRMYACICVHTACMCTIGVFM